MFKYKTKNPNKMVYIIIDETGDLGFSSKGSKYFIISAIVFNDDKTYNKLNRIPKKVRQRNLKKSLKKASELKFSNSSLLIRKQFLERAAKLPIKIYAIVVKKENVPEDLKINIFVLYNYLFKLLLEEVFRIIPKKSKIKICLDKFMSSKQIDFFENYIRTTFFDFFQTLSDIVIVQEFSHNKPVLQVADFVCGAFGYKYNTLDLKDGYEYYINIIKEKIEFEIKDIFEKRK